MSTNEFQMFIENEKNIYSSVSHPNIIKYYDSIIVDNVFYLITEFCSESLSLFASKFPNKCVPEYKALEITKDIATAMSYLNSNQILHRNLYPSNILFNGGILKICSFSFAKKVENIMDIPGVACSVGIPLYEAPEIYFKKKYSFKCDVWSLGLVLYQMLYGKLPWHAKGMGDLFEKIVNDALVFPTEPQISEFNKDLIKSMLEVDQTKRCDWQYILERTMKNED